MARRIGTADTTFDDWGIHHAAGSGATTWCGLAREIFAVADWLGAPSARVAPVTTAEYPTPARRPANSRLDCTRLERVFGLRLPAWQTGVALAVGETVGRQRMSTAA